MRKYKLKNKIKEIRQQKGLTQTELAKLIDSTQNTISSLETGQYSPTAYVSAMICKAFKCKWEECFYLEEIK